MNCEHCQELLPLRARGELPPDTEGAVAAHLRGCAACAQAASALGELQALLDVEVRPSSGLRRKVLASLEREAAQLAPAASFTTLLAKLWQQRPLGSFGYSLALVLGGMFGGQLLPFASVADSGSAAQYQLCPVPEAPGGNIL